MRVEVTSEGEINGQARTYAEYRVFAALAQLSGNVRRTRVMLRGQDGQRRGDLVTCRIVVHLDPRGMLRIRAAGAHPYEAINRAVDRLEGARDALATWRQTEDRVCEGGVVLKRGELLAGFDVRTVHGRAFSYRDVWQRRHLVLIVLRADDPASESYASALAARAAEFSTHQTECVITTDAVPGVEAPGVIVADRWGEVAHAASEPRVDALPNVDALLEWVHYLESRCPECEGEAK